MTSTTMRRRNPGGLPRVIIGPDGDDWIMVGHDDEEQLADLARMLPHAGQFLPPPRARSPGSVLRRLRQHLARLPRLPADRRHQLHGIFPAAHHHEIPSLEITGDSGCPRIHK